jgi:prepilin-type N-terminal cleavage/methylation domain-containing protein
MKYKKGFTLIELLIVIAIIGILASATLVSLTSARESAKLAKAEAELHSISIAVEFYLMDHNYQYPADQNRSVPPGLEPYLTNGTWPQDIWTGSDYDWDNWTDPATGEKIYQISIRFCPFGDPGNCNFPYANWAENFDYYSSVYYCISGPCRSHIDRPRNHPGYCVNC